MGPDTTPTETTATGATLAETTPPTPTRRLRTFAVVGAIVIALLAAAIVTWRVTAERDRAAALGIAQQDEAFSDLPPRLELPDLVQDLPADRGVGLAALLYYSSQDAYDPSTRTFKQYDVYLVTRSGEQFRVGRTPAGTGPLDIVLSPDGRWLASKRGGTWRVRDVSGTAEYEVPGGSELWLWSTDARSLVLATFSGSDRALSIMALPSGTIRPIAVSTSEDAFEVAFIAGRQLAVFTPSMDAFTTGRPVSVTLHDVETGATRDLRVVSSDQLQPGETAGTFFGIFRVGGNPPSIWAEVGRPDLLPTDSPEGAITAPSVALVGVNVATGAPSARIELAVANGFPAELCRGVVAEGVVLQRWTKTTTDLIVVEPDSNTRRVVTSFPGTVMVVVPGSRV